MTGMEHAIEQAARVMARAYFGEPVEQDDMECSTEWARALDSAGLLAPSPLREEWAARYTNGGGSISRTRDEAEAELDRMTRDSHRHRVDEPPAPQIAGIYVRHVTDWEEA